MKKTWIIMLIVVVIIIGVATGLTIYESNKKDIKKENNIENKIEEVSEKITDECTDEWEYLEEQARLEIEANSNEEKISPNCKLTLKRHYTECGHTINEYLDIPQKLVNKTEEDLSEDYPNWEIQKYSSSEIILYEEFNSNCGQHFILRNDEGKITIYILDEEENEEVYEKTEISVDYLTPTDKVEIENGIRVNGIEELNQLIENFE